MRNRLKTWDPLRPLLGGWGDVGEASGPRAVPGIPGCVCAGPSHGWHHVQPPGNFSPFNCSSAICSIVCPGGKHGGGAVRAGLLQLRSPDPAGTPGCRQLGPS